MAMSKKDIKAAMDAGEDYAADYIAWHPKKKYNEVYHEVQNCMFDLAGGDDIAADYCWEGALQYINKKFGK